MGRCPNLAPGERGNTCAVSLRKSSSSRHSRPAACSSSITSGPAASAPPGSGSRPSFERSIDPDFELARIRDEIAKLTPDMHKNISRIAEEMVAVESLERRVNDLQAKLDTAKDELALLTNAVEKGSDPRQRQRPRHSP